MNPRNDFIFYFLFFLDTGLLYDGVNIVVLIYSCRDFIFDRIVLILV